MKLLDIHKMILAECAQDNVGLWSIIWNVHQGPYTSDARLPEWIRQETIEIIRHLLQEELIEAGNFEAEETGGFKFQSMALSPYETIDYIEREWDKLGRTPNIGDICWFRATPSGERLARELNLI